MPASSNPNKGGTSGDTTPVTADAKEMPWPVNPDPNPAPGNAH